MDKVEGSGAGWGWLPAVMPGVARLVKEKRATYGEAWVNECWKRSIAGEADWFFARQGAVAVGTPFMADPQCAAFGASAISGDQALVLIRVPGGGDGKAA